MKIAYSHLQKYFSNKPSIGDLSDKLFQLGHEHEIQDGIFDMEFTPNRGDCLSLNGLSRDLNIFFDKILENKIYTGSIESLDLEFKNNAKEKCPNISFLNIEIKSTPSVYKSYLDAFFQDLNIKKVNFFTDISNYLAYEIGQPTHCYDMSSIEGSFLLEENASNDTFTPITGTNSININPNDLVFKANNKIINLAGVMGGIETACTSNTKNVLVECAYFVPESVIGRSIRYNLQSDAAHKFERGVNPDNHDYVLRRFIQIVQDHTEIKSIKTCNYKTEDFLNTELDINIGKINSILGTDFTESFYIDSLSKLGFKIDKKIQVPLYRHDIQTQNDLAEELARVVGYDNIPTSKMNISLSSRKPINNKISKIKSFLVDKGFYEVINSPFVSQNSKHSIEVDNPLDSNRKYLRTKIEQSIFENLIFNERRQKDSIKLFEISDVYSKDPSIQKQNNLAIIASGRIGNNYEDFSKKIDKNYLISLLSELSIEFNELNDFKILSRDNIRTKSKSKDKIFFIEINIENISNNILNYRSEKTPPDTYIKYSPISEFPSTNRDLSYSIKSEDGINILEEKVIGYKHKYLKDAFIFDFFKNNNKNEIKCGIRFIFQSNTETLTDHAIDTIMKDIINLTKNYKYITIPGIDHEGN